MLNHHQKLILFLTLLFGLILIAACGSTDKPASEQLPKSSYDQSVSAEAPTDNQKQSDQAPKKTESTQTKDKTDQAPVKSTPVAPSPAETAATEAAGQVHIVEIVNFGFAPEKLTIKAGDHVKFINKDEVGHSATADDDSFDTGLLDQNKAQVVTFSQDGEFSYFCLPHPGMKGTIVVIAK